MFLDNNKNLRFVYIFMRRKTKHCKRVEGLDLLVFIHSRCCLNMRYIRSCVIILKWNHQQQNKFKSAYGHLLSWILIVMHFAS